MAITVFPFGDLDHNQQVLAGLEILRRRGELSFKYRYDGMSVFGVEERTTYEFSALYQIVSVDIPGVGYVIFDMNDSDIVFKKLYDGCFLYFKRSYCPDAYNSFSKLRPLGLNYEARAPFISLSAIYRSIVLTKSWETRVRSLIRALRLPLPKPYFFDPD
jgi:hypothetical protein